MQDAVARVLDPCHAGAFGARGNDSKVPAIPDQDLDGIETRHSLGTFTCITAVPDVACKLVMVATAAVEAGTGIARSAAEAEHVAVEALGLCCITHLQLDMDALLDEVVTAY